MENRKVKYLIVGGGISGLTFANYVKDEDYLILEKENEVGGYCRTIKKKDFIFDYAGHFFHFKTEEFKKLFQENMNPDDIINNEKCTKIIYKNDLVDYPFQTNIHQLEKQEFIDCLYDLFNKEEKDEYEDFLDMLYGKFGKSIVEKFLKPYNEKLYACDLHTLDKDAMGRFFPYADLKTIINNMKNSHTGSYNNTFLYPKNGAGSFMDVLYQKLDKEKVLLENEVSSVNINDKKINTTDGSIIEYEYLINTSPLNIFLNLLDDNKYHKLSNELSYNKVLVFNLGFNKKSKYTKENWMYIPSKEINFYRIGFYDNILNTDKLSMYIEIGYGKDDEINIEEQLKLTLDNLLKLGIIDEDTKLEEYVPIVMNPAYVHINTKNDLDVKNALKELNSNHIYSIGRYGGWTYCSMEDCMIEAKDLADKLKNE